MMATETRGWGAGYSKPTDLEAGVDGGLYPGIGLTDNAMRWQFIRKIYMLVSVQLVFTACISACFIFIPDVKGFVASSDSLWFIITAMILPFVTMVPLYCYRNSHPVNLGLLALWTASISLIVGVACSLYTGPVILEALLLTAVVVISLTAYTFWASKQGHDFSFLGPILFSSLMILTVWGFIQIFLQPGPVGQFVFALIGAIIFSAYIVYDTDNIIKRYSYDDYVWASVGLYLDIVNLFLRLLEILNFLQRSG